ncbi:MAG: hypothetical protein HQL96_05490 [Magnetococcales bacterium]|nr:hypothetical protein [Magnetococcales bacterium]
MKTINVGIVALLLAFTASSTVLGDDLNKRRDMDNNSSAKMLRAEAEAMRQGSAQDMRSGKSLTKPAKCNTSVGNVTIQKGAMAPREVNTFVKGDVISVCK